MIKFKNVFLILPALCLVFAACGGSAIGDAQEFVPNEPPAIFSIKAVNMDGSGIQQLDIEPYKQFKLIVEATDPDNNPLQYKFDSESGTFAGITANSTGCTAIFKTGRVVGGQNVEFWAGVSDGKGALVRQSYNLGTGKSGPTLVAILEKIRFRPGDKVKLSVTANCSGFFQFYSNGNNETEFKFENDMFRYSYSENKTTELILGGPKCASFADIQLEPRADGIYGNDPNYNIVLVFRDGLFQTSRFIQEICVDGTPPAVVKDGFSPTGTGISTNPAVTVTFDEDIGYADSSCLKLLPDDGKVKLVSIDGKVVRFAVSGLKTSIPYTATVSGIKDIAGNPMLPNLPNSSISFTTRSDGNTKFEVKDDKGNTSYTAYCGFENDNSTVTLKATLNGGDAGVVTYTIPQNSDVSIDSSTGKLTVNTYNLKYETTKNITVTATSSSNDTAEFYVTIEPYYPIYSATRNADLVMITKNLNGRFKLMEDININDNGNNNMYPIGSYTDAYNNNPFTGIFDGGDKTLSNFKILAGQTNDKNYAGLFAYNKGTIKNLKVDSASFDNDIIDYVGIICGHNDGNGKIINCHVKNSTITAKVRVGGITGSNNGEIDSCTVTGGSITAESIVGGLIGSIDTLTGSDKKVLSSSVEGDVKGNNYVGGLIGYFGTNANLNVTIQECYSQCEVKGNNYVGGLIGYCGKSVIDGKTYAICNVTGNSDVGGLIGSADSSQDIQITGTSSNYIYSEGTVKGISNVGGLIGNALRNLKASYCKSSAEISSASTNTTPTGSDFSFGGLIGSLSAGSVEYCESSGTIKQNNVSYGIGGLIGKIENSTISYCSSKSNIIPGNSNNSHSMGGLVGYLKNSTVENCSSSGDVLKGNTIIIYVGGLIGQINCSATVKGCYHQDGVVHGKTYVGGLIGYILTGTGNPVNITGSYAKFNEIDQIKDVIAVNYAGGLIGKVEDKGTSDILVKINSCYAIAHVAYPDSYSASNIYFGGLIGHYSFTASPGNAAISKCFASGRVVAWSQIGGLIAYMKNCQIENCYSTSAVEPYHTGAINFGGLVGEMDTGCEISCCYAAGDVSNKGNDKGGLVGKNSSSSESVNNSFWKKDRSDAGQNPNNGIGDPKTDEELSTILTYSTSSWSISANKDDDVIWIMPDGVNIVYPCENPFRFNSSALPYSFPYLKNLPYPPQ